MTTLYKKQVQELNTVPNSSMRASLTKILEDLDESIGPPRIETIDNLVEMRKASAVVHPDVANAALTFTAVTGGAVGNGLSMTYVVPVVNANANTVSALAVSRSGLDITVQLKGTDAVAANKALTIVNGQNAGNNETVTIGSVVYTWKTTLTSPGVPYEVKIGATADASGINLNAAIMASGTVGTTYGAGTLKHPTVTSTEDTEVVTVTAVTAGTVGNGINISETMAQGSWAAAATVLGSGANATATIVTTAAQIDALIDADADISALVTPSNFDADNGTGVVTVMSKTTLAGGVDSTYGLDGHFALSKNALHVSKGVSDAETDNWKTIPFVNDGAQFTRECFEVQPIFAAKLLGGAATGTDGDENLMLFERNMFEYHCIGAATDPVPNLEESGLNLEMDETDTDGVEVTQGILARGRTVFTVGTDAFYFKCKFELQDVSDVNECAMGFRKAEAYQKAIDDYNAMAVLNVQAGNIITETISDGEGTDSDDTEDNWLDGETHTLEVHVSAARAVTYRIDGKAPTTPQVFSFLAGEVVVPFFHFQLDGDGSCDCFLKEWEVGLE